jgi:hypothetical protein
MEDGAIDRARVARWATPTCAVQDRVENRLDHPPLLVIEWRKPGRLASLPHNLPELIPHGHQARIVIADIGDVRTYHNVMFPRQDRHRSPVSAIHMVVREGLNGCLVSPERRRHNDVGRLLERVADAMAQVVRVHFHVQCRHAVAQLYIFKPLTGVYIGVDDTNDHHSLLAQ